MKPSQSRFSRIGRLVAAQKTVQRTRALSSHGKWKCRLVTWLSGQALAKSIGRKTPSARRTSQELKSQPKNALITRQIRLIRCHSSPSTKWKSTVYRPCSGASGS